MLEKYNELLKEYNLSKSEKRKAWEVEPKIPSWTECLYEDLKPLEELSGLKLEVTKPMGIIHKSYIELKDKNELKYSMTIIPYFDNDSNMYLKYDTQKRRSFTNKNNYIEVLDNIKDILPNTIKEIWVVMKELKISI